MTDDHTFEPAGERDGVSRFLMRSNGLEVLVREDRSAPVVAFLVLYRVGSRNEAVGYTGATHLLEHMMFKGTTDHHRDRGTQIAAVLERVGADFNATTWLDRTNYFETVPTGQLDLAVRIEADRMRNALIDDGDRQSEMTVVRNELERGENEPLSVLDTYAHATAFREHPYHHPTIGWRADVEGVSTDRLKAFYDTFYWPNNATAIVVGDVTTDEALATVVRHFGTIPASPEPVPGVYTTEPEQQGERRFVVRRAGADGIVLLSFRTAEAAHADSAPLAVVSALLGTGRSSRLYRDLVDTQLASDAAASAERFHDPGVFQVYGFLLPEVSHATVERRMLETLEKLRNETVSEAELEKARRIVRTSIVFSREGATNYGYELSEAVSSVGWEWFFAFPEEVERVTAEDVKRVAIATFRRSQLTAGWFVPVGGEEEESLTGPDAGASGESTERRSDTEEEDQDNDTRRLVPMAAAEPMGHATHRTGTFAERTARASLASGATVLSLEHAADPTVAIRANLRAGSAYAEGPRLLADVTARMLRRGTQRRTAAAFSEDVESLGAHLDASAGAFTVGVRAHALREDTATVLEAVAEMLREPRFPESELEKVRAEVAAEIRLGQDSTSDRAFERLTELVLPPDHPYHETPAEARLAELADISVADVRGFYERHYGGATLTLAAAGDVASDGFHAVAERLFGDWNGAAPAHVERDVTPARSRGREVVPMRDKANADVVMGLASGLRRMDSDYFASMLGNAVLGQSTLSSRLGIRVRDREGLTYGIASRFFGASLVDGLWYVSVTVQPSNAEQAIASTLDELRRALEDGVTDDEVDAYVSNFIGTFKVGLATNAGMVGRLVDAEFYGLGPGYLDDFGGIVSAVTRDDVNAALRRHVHLDRLTTVIAGEF
ncbi:MAG: insulinase family protein [Blastocatellia bacterium]|nr:insulinase family protein [Blastocatellia bacterium]